MAELESFKMEYANARLECNAADERANILASKVIGLEKKKRLDPPACSCYLYSIEIGSIKLLSLYLQCKVNCSGAFLLSSGGGCLYISWILYHPYTIRAWLHFRNSFHSSILVINYKYEGSRYLKALFFYHLIS
ncbi:hypothetical protein ES332_D08G198000v1 [Gossypium tomentosum]|uniref:Uncharacterized protein n=1 Tax=Gossypium tomentosum TaxID=34277 RepID=A0A5D2JW53_GOSTO|nr:hypothetical protein ES332_D08G198000v1 [Gossypium tomentosum]